MFKSGGDAQPLQQCICDIPTAERLVTDARVAFFSFIGSANVGWYLRSQLAPGTRCALEHGGAAPVIICNDAHLQKTVPSLVKDGYYHAGQVCVPVQRIFVDNRIKEAFRSAFDAHPPEVNLSYSLAAASSLWSDTYSQAKGSYRVFARAYPLMHSITHCYAAHVVICRGLLS